MTSQNVKAWIAKNKWAVALVLVIAGGYIVGKDLSFRDNLAEVEAGETV